jgi:hypothetical protein
MRTLMAVTALVCLFGSSAEARSGHHYYRHHQHYAGRPGAWCGWYIRSQVGCDLGPNYSRGDQYAIDFKFLSGRCVTDDTVHGPRCGDAEHLASLNLKGHLLGEACNVYSDDSIVNGSAIKGIGATSA